MLPLRRPAALRRRQSKAMAGPAMPSRMPKEPMPNLIPMLRKNRQVDGQRQVEQRGDQAAQVDSEVQVRSFQRIS